MSDRLADSASRLAGLLEQLDSERLALAESCTGGTVSAAFIRIPGVSRFFCGSAVTYRPAAKTAWLGVPAELIAAHTDVSPEVTERMSTGLLETISEATVGGAITGHVGPMAPAVLDGTVYIAIAARQGDRSDVIVSQSHQLKTRTRTERVEEAAAILLEELVRAS